MADNAGEIGIGGNSVGAPPPRSRRIGVPHATVVTGLVLVALAGGCSSDETSFGGTEDSPTSVEPTDPSTDGAERFPEVVDVGITAGEGEEFTVSVTLSSPYDSPEQYADAWRVLDEEGNELGVRELTHDHASEQPFTRSETIRIPAGVRAIMVEGRDLLNGYGGATVTVDVPGA